MFLLQTLTSPATFNTLGRLQGPQTTVPILPFFKSRVRGEVSDPNRGGVEPMMCIRTIEWNKQQWSVRFDMSDPAAQALQPRLHQAQSGGTAGSNAAAVGSGSGNSDPVRPGLSQQQRASQKKAQVRAFPRAKKLEKLGVFSACKVAS